MSENNKLFSVGTSYSVDPKTGETIPVEGGGLKMLPVKPGTCEFCAVKHGKDEPHDQQSLTYQVKFHQIHGRYPTWTDALSHCDEKTQSLWKRVLVELFKEKGKTIPEDLMKGI